MLQQGDEESLKSSDTNSELGAPDNDTSIDGDEVDAELDPRVQVCLGLSVSEVALEKPFFVLPPMFSLRAFPLCSN